MGVVVSTGSDVPVVCGWCCLDTESWFAVDEVVKPGTLVVDTCAEWDMCVDEEGVEFGNFDVGGLELDIFVVDEAVRCAESDMCVVDGAAACRFSIWWTSSKMKCSADFSEFDTYFTSRSKTDNSNIKRGWSILNQKNVLRYTKGYTRN